jgi:2',3'-cyclic-nucleotide 2'-phosphodiesterase (5'-nucleotidase family)/predicted extracellular nuclease
MGKKYHRNKIAVSVIAASVVATAGFVIEADAATFTDIDNNIHAEAIKNLADQGVIHGFGNDLFGPTKSLTRGQAAKIIVNSLGLDTKNVINPNFKDISTSHEFYKEIAALKATGAINGHDDGTFRSGDPITREQLAKVIAIAYKLTLDKNYSTPFIDIKNSFYKDYIAALYKGEITKGKSATTFDPRGIVQRGEMASFAVRANNYSNSTDDFNLTILHTNDTHSRTEIYPKLATAVKAERETDPKALLIDAGDVFSGTLYFTKFEGQADVKLMNYIGYDVMTLGNHEFDLGSSPEGHKALADFIKAAKFPFVSTNIDASKDKILTGLFSDLISSKPAEGKIYQGMIKEINGEKVGFFGLTTPETKYISSPIDVNFKEYLDTANKAVATFKDMGINKIVAVTHIGYDDNPTVDNDLLLAEYVDGIDVIVGGHSHTALNQATVIDKKEPTVIVQTGEFLNNLGKLNVKFDAKGVVKEANGQLIALDKFAEDAGAVEILKPYKEEIAEMNNQEIGVTLATALETPRDGGDETKPSVRKNQTILGNIITDGMLKKAKEVAKPYNKNIVMAFTNGGGIRAAINAGPVTLGEVRTVLPFGNTLAMMDVTGAELKAAFELSVGQFPKESGGFLHIAGGYVKFDASKPAGKRIVSIAYKNEQGAYVDLEDDQTYTVATNAFTAKGGDGFTMFEAAYKEGRVTDFGLNDWENFRDYLIEIKDEIPTTLEKRIENVVNDDESENQTISIKEARTLANGADVRLKGTVTGFAGTVYHMTDGTASIALYNTAVNNLSVGDEVVVSGKLGQYRNLLQVASFKVEEHKKGAKEVVPQVVAGKDVNEENESAYAVVKKVTITKDNGSGNFAATTEDGGSFVVRAVSIPGIVVGKTYDSITGHIQQFNNDYQIVVGSANDIVEDETVTKNPVANQTAKLIAAGSEIILTSGTKDAKIYYTTDDSEPSTASTEYKAPIKVNTKTTIKAIAVADGLKNSEVVTFTYDVYDAEKGLQIHDIQGASHESPLAGSTVSNIEGVVTGTYELNGGYYFYLQTPDAKVDDKPETSEGIIIYAGNKNLNVKVGNLVKVTGNVSEYHIDGSSSKTTTDLTVTQINIVQGTFDVVEESVALPTPIKITDANLNQKVIDNDSFGKFDPEEDAIDFWESLEGMRVETGTVRATAPQNYGEFYAVLDTVEATTKNGGMLLTEQTASPNLINFRLYNTPATKTTAEEVVLKTGDKFTGPIIGLVNYGYSNYKVVVDYEEIKNALVAGTVTPETSADIIFDENKLTVATYNIENFSANTIGTTDDRAKRIAEAIIDLGKPDIIGLTEVQDNDGETASNNSAADKSYERLIAAIKANGGPEYKYINIDPEYDKDGGAPGANIRPGFLYNPARVTFNEKGTISNNTAAVYEADGLVVNPSLIDPKNPAFTASRKPLVAQFTFGDEEVLVIANHWNSKSGDLPTWGKVQPVSLGSEAQRVQIAEVVGKFVTEVKAKNPKANIIALGDFNDFQWSAPLKRFETFGMRNMINEVPLKERYTYSYQGNSQVLDHILVSENLKSNTVIDILNINADFTEGDGRASDHNPVIIQVEFTK